MLSEFDGKARDWDNNPLQITIREEKPEDYSPVSELIAAAFRSMPHADGDEQLLVEVLRKNIAFIPALSLVSETIDMIYWPYAFYVVSDNHGLTKTSDLLATVSGVP